MTIERRAALEAAFDADQEEQKADEVVPNENEVQQDAVVEQQPQSGVEKDPKEPVDTQKVEQQAADKSQAPTISKPGEKPAADTTGIQDSGIKPPTSWKATEKEHWAKIPKEAQEAIQRRELETQRALSGSANARKFQDEFVNVVKPFAHLIRAQNSHPLQAVQNLMTTAAGLTTGSPEQKAKIVAEIISNYGVDIQALDSVLANQPVTQNAGHAAIPPQFAQMLQPIHSFMEEIKSARARREQQVAEQAAATVEQFGAGKPLFDELRDDMADLMEMAARRGRDLTIEQAYNIALAQHPDGAKHAQTGAPSNVSQAAAILANARKKAVSVRGAPAGGGGAKQPTDRRSALEAAYDEFSR